MKDYEEDFIVPLLAYFGATENVNAMREKIIGNNRADMMLLTDAGVVGVEVKSSHDTPKRMQAQLECLCGVCRLVYLAVNLDDAARYTALVENPNVGVLAMADGEMRLYRPARDNTPVPRFMFQFMHAGERRLAYKERNGCLPWDKHGTNGVYFERRIIEADMEAWPRDFAEKWMRNAMRRALRRRAECLGLTENIIPEVGREQELPLRFSEGEGGSRRKGVGDS